jgi:hypothetical protein
MNSMTTSSQINDLGEFLSKHNATSLGKTSTHTRIRDDALNIYGGNYSIDKEELPLYYRLYYESVFVKGRKEYLTEAQLKDGTGPLLVDFDFRYDFAVTDRQHTIGHIQDVIQLYLEELKELLIFREKTPFPIFVMEKPHVNRVTEKTLTKDGIHMIFGIQIDHTLQQILREQIISKLSDIWELPLTNDWSSVLDEGITKGFNLYWLVLDINSDENFLPEINLSREAIFRNRTDCAIQKSTALKMILELRKYHSLC